MNRFCEVAPEDFRVSPFQMIGSDWMLIAAEREGKTNAMTAAWGGMGVMWGKNAAFVFIRESRYTKEFVEAADHFSLSFFDRAKYADMLTYMGRVSGRDEDKIAHAGLSVISDSAPYFEEANTVLICRKMSRHFIAPEGILDPAPHPRYYPAGDYHDMYIGEIEKILVRE